SEAAVGWTEGSTLETGSSQGGACWSPMVDTRSEEVFLSAHNRHKHSEQKPPTV
ncbi:hypothetical protein GOODEAATRI_028624, partial [Goodea atripinnis]